MAVNQQEQEQVESTSTPQKKGKVIAFPRPKGISRGQKIGLTVAATLAAIEGVGAVVNEQKNDIPVSSQSIKADLAWPWNLGKSVVEDIQRMLHKETAVPPTFDNNKEKQIIGDNNIRRVTPEEAEREGLLNIKFDEEKKTVTMLSPFILPQGTTATIDTSIYETRGIKHNEPRAIVPAGTEIILPKGMHYRLVGGDTEQNKDPGLVYSPTAVEYDQGTNTTTVLSFYPYDERQQKDIPFSTNLPITPYKDLYPNGVIIPESGNVDYWMGLPVSDGLAPIATTTSNQLIHILVSAFNGKELKASKKIENIQVQWQQQDGKLLVLAPSK